MSANDDLIKNLYENLDRVNKSLEELESIKSKKKNIVKTKILTNKLLKIKDDINASLEMALLRQKREGNKKTSKDWKMPKTWRLTRSIGNILAPNYDDLLLDDLFNDEIEDDEIEDDEEWEGNDSADWWRK